MDESFSFNDWLTHRERRVGLASHRELAAAAGLDEQTVDRILTRGSLAGASRTTRNCIARALSISIRDLERLAQGNGISAVGAKLVDATRLGPLVPRPAGSAVGLPTPARAGHGVPVVGTLFGDGTVEWCEGWSSEEGDRLSVRFPGAPDAFSLLRKTARPARRRRFVVFRPLLPAEIETFSSVLITWTDGSPCGRTRVGLAAGASKDACLGLYRLTLPPGIERVPREAIVRAATLIRSFTQHNEASHAAFLRAGS